MYFYLQAFPTNTSSVIHIFKIDRKNLVALKYFVIIFSLSRSLFAYQVFPMSFWTASQDKGGKVRGVTYVLE